jgi:hypothetical protein
MGFPQFVFVSQVFEYSRSAAPNSKEAKNKILQSGYKVKYKRDPFSRTAPKSLSKILAVRF